MKSFFKHAVITGLSLKLASFIVPGIQIESAFGWIAATVLLTALNEFVRPVMVVLALPLLIFTLGLFYLVINMVLLALVGHLGFLGSHFTVDSYGAAFWGSLVISILTLILKSLTGTTGRASVHFRRSGGSPPAMPKNGGGPVIDV